MQFNRFFILEMRDTPQTIRDLIIFNHLRGLIQRNIVYVPQSTIRVLLLKSTRDKNKYVRKKNQRKIEKAK